MNEMFPNPANSKAWLKRLAPLALVLTVVISGVSCNRVSGVQATEIPTEPLVMTEILPAPTLSPEPTATLMPIPTATHRPTSTPAPTLTPTLTQLPPSPIPTKQVDLLVFWDKDYDGLQTKSSDEGSDEPVIPGLTIEPESCQPEMNWFSFNEKWPVGMEVPWEGSDWGSGKLATTHSNGPCDAITLSDGRLAVGWRWVGVDVGPAGPGECCHDNYCGPCRPDGEGGQQ